MKTNKVWQKAMGTTQASESFACGLSFICDPNDDDEEKDWYIQMYSNPVGNGRTNAWASHLYFKLHACTPQTYMKAACG